MVDSQKGKGLPKANKQDTRLFEDQLPSQDKCVL